ncbi:MAG: hypothetical protein LUF26_04490 [Firmicutes bacterium]|nr:hypothetical protein [Bacillota bacterium]
MKKFYITLCALAGLFLLCLAVMILNPEYINLYRARPDGNIINLTPAGETAMLIAGIVFALIILALIVYFLYKYIRKLSLKIRGKEDTKDYTSDSAEFMTEKQSSEGLAEWLISVRRGRLEKENNKDKKESNNRKK